MMTAYGELELIHQAWKLGAIHHLTKPFDVFEVKTLLQQLVSDAVKIKKILI